MTHHDLKTHPEYFNNVWEGRKRFELRKDDRGFHEGDIIHLREWEPITKKYTGRVVSTLISYILRHKTGLNLEYCVISFIEISKDIEEVTS
jgi:hypothetical protein